MKPQGLPRCHRIARRSDFLRAYEHGQRTPGRLAVLFALPTESVGDDVPPPWRLGLTTTRKVGCAVERNRLRRRVREFFRRRGERWPEGWDFVVNLRRAACEVSAEELNRELIALLARRGIDSGDGSRGQV